MLSQGNISASEVKRLLRKYWWILPITIGFAAAIGYTATLFLPKKYTSSTTVLVEPPAVATDVVPAAVNEDLYRHLASMKQQILSRSRLQPLIVKFNLFPKSPEDSAHMDTLVENLKQMIDVELIEPMPGSVNRQPPGFHVAVTLSDPQTAQQVCTEITSMFMEQNASTQEKKFKDTTNFLTQQLQEAKSNLDEQDQKLADFKRQHWGTLPDQDQHNLSLLAGLNTQLDAATQGLSRAQQDKTFNESLLTQQEALWKSSQTGAGNPQTLDDELAALQDQLSVLLSKYTPEHPDVVKTKAEIEEVKKRMEAGGDPKLSIANAPAAHEPPQLQQLRARIKQDEMNISDLTKRQSQIQKQIGGLEGNIQASPVVEQQMKELTRNYQTALDHYNDLLKSQQKSEMLTDLQDQQEGETYRVLDPPSLPATPSYPKKIMFVGGGAGAGFALGMGLLYLLAISDKAMYTEHDIELCLKLPVLTLVPSFDVVELSEKRHGKEDTALVAKV